MSAIANLKKAHAAQSVNKDDFSLQKYFNKFEENGIATLNLVALESKYVPKFDKRHLEEGTVEGAGNMGFRTRFILADGTTVGAFSNGAHNFYTFFATLMGFTGEENFTHIDITGNVLVEVSLVALDTKRSTYNFNIVEEGSDLKGFEQYVPTLSGVMTVPTLPYNKETGEIEEEPSTEAAEETSSTATDKSAKNSKDKQ